MVIIIAAPAITSCKKGEEDPFLSLKSRKARLVGEWKLVSGTEVTNSNEIVKQTTYTGSTATETVGPLQETYIYVETLTFGKNYEYKMELLDDGDICKYEGFWAFMKGYDEIANKECVVVRIGKVLEAGNFTELTGEMMYPEVFRFLKLSSKEVVIESEGTFVYAGNTYSYTSTKTYEKK